jgi:hypothetical protein
MNKPIKPKKPKEPKLVYNYPDKINFSSNISLLEILTLVPKEVALDDVKINYCEDDYNSAIFLEIYTQKYKQIELNNKTIKEKYEQDYKKYQKDLNKFEKLNLKYKLLKENERAN